MSERERRNPLAERIDTDPESVERGLVSLVLTRPGRPQHRPRPAGPLAHERLMFAGDLSTRGGNCHCG